MFFRKCSEFAYVRIFFGEGDIGFWPTTRFSAQRYCVTLGIASAYFIANKGLNLFFGF